MRLPQGSTGSSAAVSEAGVASLPFRCTSTVACRGGVELFANLPSQSQALAASKRVKIGSSRLSVAAGKKVSLKIRLSRTARQLVRQRKRLRVELVIALNSQSGVKKVKRQLTLVAPKR